MDDLMAVEHTAWGAVCQEFRSLTGKEPNSSECDVLFKTIIAWSEELVALRVSQDPATRESVRTTARGRLTVVLAERDELPGVASADDQLHPETGEPLGGSA